MAMTRADHRVETVADTSGTLSATCTAFTPQNDSLVVATIAVNMDADGGTNNAISGYTRLATVGVSGGGYFQRLEIWVKAIVGVAASQSITVTNAVTIGDSLTYFQVSSVTEPHATQNGGTATDSTLGETGDGAMTLSAAPVAADLTVAARFFFPVGSTDPTATPGSGWTESYDTTGTGGYGGLETQWRASSTSDAVVWTNINVEGISVVTDVGIAVVIKAAVAGAVQQFLMKPTNMDGMGRGGIFPGNRL